MQKFTQSGNLSFCEIKPLSCFMEFNTSFLKMTFLYHLNLAGHTSVCQEESFFKMLMSSDHTFVSFMLSHLHRNLERPELKNQNSQASPPKLFFFFFGHCLQSTPQSLLGACCYYTVFPKTQGKGHIILIWEMTLLSKYQIKLVIYESFYQPPDGFYRVEHYMTHVICFHLQRCRGFEFKNGTFSSRAKCKQFNIHFPSSYFTSSKEFI